ncbi:MAG: hypothetical protein WC667_04200 [Sulfurimonas sp.]|jgi:hypothetical protein
MKKYLLSMSALSLATVMVLGMSGCGSSDSSSSTPTTTPTTPTTPVVPVTTTDVTVERGPVYDANVTDAAGQVAQQKAGLNVYSFTQTPTYPITVNGGWVDLDGDKIKSVNDMPLNITMQSYSNTITPVTTYIADGNQTVMDAKLQALLAIVNADGTNLITAEDLLKIASVAPQKVQMAINAVYAEMIQNPHGENQNNILGRINNFKNQNLDANMTSRASAMAYENQLLGDPMLHANKFTQSDLPVKPTVSITPDMLAGKIFYSIYNDYSFGNIINGKFTINADNTFTYHEVQLDSNGVLMADSEWTDTMSYGLSNGQLTIMGSGDGDKVFTLNSVTASAWSLTDERGEPNTWYLTKPAGFPSNL